MRYWAYNKDVLVELLNFDPKVFKSLANNNYSKVIFNTGMTKAVKKNYFWNIVGKEKIVDVTTFNYYSEEWMLKNKPEFLV